MGRAVILRHELADGSHHFDWLVEPNENEEPSEHALGDHRGDGADERVLIAWRVGATPGEACGGEVEADRLAPHRRHYLQYEGPISGGRGEVARVDRGRGKVLDDSPTRFRGVLELQCGSFEIIGAPADRGRWLLRVSRIGPGA